MPCLLRANERQFGAFTQRNIKTRIGISGACMIIDQHCFRAIGQFYFMMQVHSLLPEMVMSKGCANAPLISTFNPSCASAAL